ncbi:MAG TPA: F0F1 ATP synthase subunit A [Candidatus Binatia bacterium]|nr:F0F1 ATP synthase subunit A [Candidatus Binatia bacterium]
MQENLGEHLLWHVPVLGPVHADTIVTTWIVMALALAFFAWVGASYRHPSQTKRQVVVEGVVNYVADLATSTLGKRGEPFVPFFIALFVFIFLLNQFGMLPLRALGLPVGGSPTADLNTTVPLALTVWLATWLLFPTSHAKHLVQPFAWLLPINLIEEFSRPLTLAARLFFNIFVGELLFLIVSSIIQAHITIGALNLSLAVTVAPFFIQFFNFFVGTVQAFVFTLLAIVYFSLAIGESH